MFLSSHASLLHQLRSGCIQLLHLHLCHWHSCDLNNTEVIAHIEEPKQIQLGNMHERLQIKQVVSLGGDSGESVGYIITQPTQLHAEFGKTHD